MNPKMMAAYALLLVGISLSAAFGARNGEDHSAFRRANWLVEELSTEDPDKLEDLRSKGVLQGKPKAALREAKAARDSIGLPPPMARLTGWLQVGGAGWFLGVVFITGGAFLARRTLAEENAGGGSGGAGRVDFPKSVVTIVETLKVIQDEIAELPYDDDAPLIRERIDTLFDEVIAPVVEGRGQLVARHGLGGFAEYFGSFAAGERNLARCWSGLTDGHAGVARESLANAIAAFEQAGEAWDAVDAEHQA